MTRDDAATLLDSWLLHLRAERKSPHTIKSYRDGVHAFLGWCDEHDVEPQLDRATVNTFVVALIDAGAEAATARSRQLAVRRWSAWLAEENEIPTDELVTLKPPKLDIKVTPVLAVDTLKGLIKVCAGPTFLDRRDEAMVRFMAETGARAGEVVGMEVADVDLPAGIAIVRRGKGGKGRRVPFGPQTGRAVDRYLRVRRKHLLAETARLWLGDRGKGLGYDGLYSMLQDRAAQAGIEGFFPHVLRHTAASRWLAKGGSEGGLMAVAGWTRRDMIDRYVAATAAERAAEEARGLALGDL